MLVKHSFWRVIGFRQPDCETSKEWSEFHVATLDRETRNKHKSAGRWTGGCYAKILGK